MLTKVLRYFEICSYTLYSCYLNFSVLVRFWLVIISKHTENGKHESGFFVPRDRQVICWFNPLQPCVTFLYPLKTSENKSFLILMFSGGIEKQRRAVMG